MLYIEKQLEKSVSCDNILYINTIYSILNGRTENGKCTYTIQHL